MRASKTTKQCKGGRPALPGPLILIEWVDASRLATAWMDWADIPDPYPHRCVTVGFLAAENEQGIILVPTIGDIEHEENRHTYGGMMVPRSAIKSRQTGLASSFGLSTLPFGDRSISHHPAACGISATKITTSSASRSR